MSLRRVAALGLAILLPALAPAGEKQQEPAPVFGAGVSVVSIPAFVVDRQGKALRGLGPEDFELYDDGKRVSVVSFQYVDTTSPEEQEAIREAPPARRRFLFLFDLSFTDLGGLHRARAAAREIIRRRLAPSDLAAVATLDVNRGARVVANFTEDRALLIHAVDTLGIPSLARINDPLSLAGNIQALDIEGARLDSRSGEISQAIADAGLLVLARLAREAEHEMYRRRVLGMLGSLEDLGKALRSIEGRKQVVYFSAGFDSRVLVGVSGSERWLDSEALAQGRIWEVDGLNRYGDSRLRGALDTMVRALSNADCVVHSIDVNGLGEDRSLGRAEALSPGDTSHDVSGRESLNFVASETGGRFFKDTNNLSAVLGEVLDMTSRYYILGYQPEDLRGPGRFHKIKVKVVRKGASVSHRSGYYERLPRDTQTPLQRKFEAAQLVMTGVGWDTLRFSALCLPFPTPGDRQSLGVLLQIPKEQVRWESPLALEVYGYAVAVDGTVLDHLAQLVRVDPGLADPEGEAQGVSFYGTLQVPPGQYTIKLMVQEPASGSAGVQLIEVSVPAHDPRVGFLLPPIVIEDARRWIGLRVGAGTSSRSDFRLAVSGRDFLPRASFSVRKGIAEKLAVIGYDPSGPSDTASSGLEIRSSVTDRAGIPVSPGRLRIERVLREEGGRRTYLFVFTPDEWVPGDYTLRIGVGEAGTQLESYAMFHVGRDTASR